MLRGTGSSCQSCVTPNSSQQGWLSLGQHVPHLYLHKILCFTFLFIRFMSARFWSFHRSFCTDAEAFCYVPPLLSIICNSAYCLFTCIIQMTDKDFWHVQDFLNLLKWTIVHLFSVFSKNQNQHLFVVCTFIPPNTHIQIFLFIIHHSHTETNKTESQFCQFISCTTQIHQDWGNSRHVMMYKRGAWWITL